MKYRDLKKAIKRASKEKEVDGIICYIAYTGEREETLVSNFLSDRDVEALTDNQLIRAENEGLLYKDWDTLEVI